MQYSILELCCKNPTDYNDLCKQLGKSRITILQSVNSLVRYGYVEKHQVNPKREKSRIIIKPTYRGMNEAYQLGADAQDILKKVEDGDVNEFIHLIKELPEVPRIYMYHHLALNFLGSGRWMDEVNKKGLLKECFNNGLLESIADPEFNAGDLFNDNIKNWLAQLYSPKDLKILKKDLLIMNNNLDLVIKELPV